MALPTCNFREPQDENVTARYLCETLYERCVKLEPIVLKELETTLLFHFRIIKQSRAIFLSYHELVDVNDMIGNGNSCRGCMGNAVVFYATQAFFTRVAYYVVATPSAIAPLTVSLTESPAPCYYLEIARAFADPIPQTISFPAIKLSR